MADIHATCTPVGIGGLARRLGAHSTTVRRWVTSRLLPEPRGPDWLGRWTVDGRPVWCWEHDIVPWLRFGRGNRRVGQSVGDVNLQWRTVTA